MCGLHAGLHSASPFTMRKFLAPTMCSANPAEDCEVPRVKSKEDAGASLRDLGYALGLFKSQGTQSAHKSVAVCETGLQIHYTSMGHPQNGAAVNIIALLCTCVNYRLLLNIIYSLTSGGVMLAQHGSMVQDLGTYLVA